MCGAGIVTVTVKLHEALRSCASVAVQETAVAPTGKLEPLVGVHDDFTGAIPPETVGGGNATGAPTASTRVVCDGGHAIVGGSDGEVGADGEPQPTAEPRTADERITRR